MSVGVGPGPYTYMPLDVKEQRFRNPEINGKGGRVIISTPVFDTFTNYLSLPLYYPLHKAN